MKRGITMRLLIGMAIAFAVTGCLAPKTFVKTMEPSWAGVELRSDISYDNAWAMVMDTLTKRFDIEIMSRQDGYIRTSWLYTWTGKVNENYRVRLTAKFSPDHKMVQIKSEAEYGGPGSWVMGYDSRLLETVKTDLMDTIGRTTPQRIQNEYAKPQGAQTNNLTPQEVKTEDIKPQGTTTESIAPQGVVSDEAKPQGAQAESVPAQEVKAEDIKPQGAPTESIAPQGVKTEDIKPQGGQSEDAKLQGGQQ